MKISATDVCSRCGLAPYQTTDGTVVCLQNDHAGCTPICIKGMETDHDPEDILVALHAEDMDDLYRTYHKITAKLGYDDPLSDQLLGWICTMEWRIRMAKPQKTRYTKERLKGRLNSSYEGIHVEPGWTHPVDAIIKDSLPASEPWLIEWSCDPTYKYRADLLSSLRHLKEFISYKARYKIALFGLRGGSPTIRDEIIQCIEVWGDARLIALLRRHEDETTYLQEYAEKVIAEYDAAQP